MSTLDRWILEAELNILRTNRHPGGAGAVLDVLINRKRSAKSEAEEWVDIDTISALTGQRAVHSRVAELRNDWKWAIEHNGRAGGKSKYRLVDAAPVAD
jgi:hypothetical protein